MLISIKEKAVSIIMALVLVFCCNPMSVLAEEEIEVLQLGQVSDSNMSGDNIVYGQNNIQQNGNMRAAAIVYAELSISNNSSGIYFQVSTGTNVISEEIGVKDIKVQKKVWYGWKTVATSSGYDTNTDSYAGATTYTGAEKAETYRITCTHYAKGSGFELTLKNSTNEFIYN